MTCLLSGPVPGTAPATEPPFRAHGAFPCILCQVHGRHQQRLSSCKWWHGHRACPGALRGWQGQVSEEDTQADSATSCSELSVQGC